MSIGRPPSPLATSAQERATLAEWSQGDDQRLATRATLILALAEGASNNAVAARFGLSKQTVGKWRSRFQRRRLDGLMDDPRSGAPRRIGDDDVGRVLTLTMTPPPAGVARWTTRLLARTCGLSQTAVSRIWRSHGLSPRSSPSPPQAGVGLVVAEKMDEPSDLGPAPPSGPAFLPLGPRAPSFGLVGPDQLLVAEPWPDVDGFIDELRQMATSLEAHDNDSLRSAVEVLQAAHTALAAASRLNAQQGAELVQETRRRAWSMLANARKVVQQSQEMRRNARGPRGPSERMRLTCEGCGRHLRLFYAGANRASTKFSLACPGCERRIEVLCPADARQLRLE